MLAVDGSHPCIECIKECLCACCMLNFLRLNNDGQFVSLIFNILWIRECDAIKWLLVLTWLDVWQTENIGRGERNFSSHHWNTGRLISMTHSYSSILHIHMTRNIGAWALSTHTHHPNSPSLSMEWFASLHLYLDGHFAAAFCLDYDREIYFCKFFRFWRFNLNLCSCMFLLSLYLKNSTYHVETSY